MQLHALKAALLAALFLPGVALANKVVFVNQSSWDITHIYFSPSNAKKWGKDHLKNEILEQGDSLTLTGVSKGQWDVRVIDEDGDECILSDITINANDKWVIEDEDLLACQNQ